MGCLMGDACPYWHAEPWTRLLPKSEHDHRDQISIPDTEYGCNCQPGLPLSFISPMTGWDVTNDIDDDVFNTERRSLSVLQSQILRVAAPSSQSEATQTLWVP